MITSGGTTTLGLYDNASAIKKKADITYVDSMVSGISGGHKGYETLALATTATPNLPANTIVEVTNDTTTENNGLYLWDGISLVKSAYDPLTQAKADATTKANAAEANAKSYAANNGSAKIVAAAASSINYTTADRKLTFANTIYILSATSVQTLVTPQEIVFATNGSFRLEFNKSSRTLRAVAYNAAKVDGWLDCGYVTASASGIITSDFDFRVNGAIPSGQEIGKIITNTHLTINLSTDTGFLITRGNGRVVSSSRTIVLPEYSAALPTTNGFYRVEYNAYANIIEINASSSANKIGNVFFATLIKNSLGFNLYGVDIYSVNGVQASSISEPPNTGVLLGALPTDINFDFVAKTLTIENQKVRFLRNGKTSLLTGQVLDISSNTGAWHSIVVDTNNNLALRIVTAQNVVGDIVVGNIRVIDQQITGMPYFSVQGKTSRENSNLRNVKFIMPFGNVEPDYSQPALPAYSSLQMANMGDYTKFYALYDALMAAHPDYITKTVLGADALGNPINQYQFSTPDVNTVAELSVKPKIVILSGVHGSEQAGMYNTYFALKEIIERWMEDSHLEALYWGVNFIVVPVSNPTGYNANSRFNHNNVDIARNFPAGWSTVLANSGTAPLSEAETVILDAVMSNNRDAIYLCSHHNFGDASTYFIWNPAASNFSRDLGKNLIIGQTIRAKKRYEWMPQANNYYIGYSDLGQPDGSEGRQAVDKYAINASSFEICASFAWESGKPTYSSAVATIGVEAFINWLLMNIKYAPQLYNTRINL